MVSKMSLNPQQYAAVTHTTGPLLILAGAGTGKTHVITSRIQHLLKSKQTTPEKILAVTFTNKAAQEMRERIGVLIGSKSAQEMTICTFHALGLSIIRRDSTVIGYKPNVSIYTEGDQSGLIRSCMQELNIDTNTTPLDSVVSAIGRAKNALITPQDFQRQADTPYSRHIAAVYERYQNYLRGYNAIDFDDIIMLAVRILQYHEPARSYWQERFSHIMVDEYQDTNAGQFQMVRLLAEGHLNICVVGDDDQSIYGWRGADISNILSYDTTYPGCTVITLEQNYRSSGTILNAANAVIRQNRQRTPKALWTAVGSGAPITLLESPTEHDEARRIIDDIRIKQFKNKRRYADIAILYRSNHLSRVFEEVLLEDQIPYQLIGGTRFYERKEVKDALAYLIMLTNPRDEAALVRTLTFPKRGIGPTTLQALQRHSLNNRQPLFETIKAASSVLDITPSARKGLADYVTFIEQEQRQNTGHQLALQVQGLFKRAGIHQEIYRINDDIRQAEKRIDNLEQIISGLAYYEERTPGATLEGYLERLMLMEDGRSPDNSSADEEQDRVVLMSLHASKGLEFPVVYLVGFEDGILPHSTSLADDPEGAEERRLCYVGITRAKQELTLSYCSSRRKYGAIEEQRPSRFLADIPKELTQPAEQPPSTTTSASMAQDFFASIRNL